MLYHLFILNAVSYNTHITKYCWFLFESGGRVRRSFRQVWLTHKFGSCLYLLEKHVYLVKQALHILHHHHVLIVAGIRTAHISVGEKIALFESRSTLPCVGRLVVINQRPLLFFIRRKMVGVFSCCKQEWDKIRHSTTQGIILEIVDFSGFRSRY